MKTTIARSLWQKGTLALQSSSSTPSLDALLLLCHVLGLTKESYWHNPDQELSQDQMNTYQTLITKRREKEPLAYLIHKKEFWGKTFFVDKRVLIPRPDTEILVESAWELLKAHPSLTHVFDVGTGSGAIGLSIAASAPTKKVHLIDISPEALQVAYINRKRFTLTQVPIYQGSLLSGWEKLPNHSLILGNLPYLTEEEVLLKESLYPHEPHIALMGGGAEGLALIHELLDQIICKRQGKVWIILEVSCWQIPLLWRTMKKKNFHDVSTKKDLSGQERIIVACL